MPKGWPKASPAKGWPKARPTRPPSTTRSATRRKPPPAMARTRKALAWTSQEEQQRRPRQGLPLQPEPLPSNRSISPASALSSSYPSLSHPDDAARWLERRRMGGVRGGFQAPAATSRKSARETKRRVRQVPDAARVGRGLLGGPARPTWWARAKPACTATVWPNRGSAAPERQALRDRRPPKSTCGCPG